MNENKPKSKPETRNIAVISGVPRITPSFRCELIWHYLGEISQLIGKYIVVRVLTGEIIAGKVRSINPRNLFIVLEDTILWDVRFGMFDLDFIVVRGDSIVYLYLVKDKKFVIERYRFA